MSLMGNTDVILPPRNSGIDALIRFGPILVFACLVATIFLQWTPRHLFTFERMDSGIFMYVGEQLRNGIPLYRGVWDHKPPIIFYFNEFGLALTGGTPRGVFSLYYLVTLAFFSLSFAAVQQFASKATAFVACLLGMLLFADLSTLGPNGGEVISLPIQAACFLLLLKDLKTRPCPVRATIQGALFGLLFWTKPNCIAISGVYLCVAGFLLLRSGNYKAVCKIIAGFAISAGVVSALVVLPAVIQSSFSDVWFATFQFNKIYAGLVTNGERIHTLLWLIFYSTPHGVILIAIAGFLGIVISRPSVGDYEGLVRWAVLFWFALEAACSAYTGKPYGKDAILWVLPCVCAIAFFVDSLMGRKKRDAKQMTAATAAGLAVAMFIIYTGMTQWRENARQAAQGDWLAERVDQMTAVSDRVLFWGHISTGTIFRANRVPGSRFFTSTPLMHGATTYRRLAPLVLTDAEELKPKWIVEQDGADIAPLLHQESSREPSAAMSWETDELRERKLGLAQSYTLAWQDPHTQTYIYLRR